jgi:hypothetical protein
MLRTCLVSLEHEGRVELIVTEWNSWDQKPKQSQYDTKILGNTIVKYFVHVLVFAIFLPVFYFIFESLLLAGVAEFDISVALIVFGLFALSLPLFFGYLNGEIARRLWGLNPKKAVTTWYGQGFLIFFMLPLFGSFYYYFVLFAMVGLSGFIVVSITLIILNALASGYIGRYVAAEFEGAREGTEELASVSDRHIICPHCRSRFTHQIAKMDLDGFVSCPHCGGKVSGQPDGPQPTDSFDSFKE